MPDVWRRVSIVDCRSNEVFHLIELTLKLHNKIAKVTKPNNFTTRSRRPQRLIGKPVESRTWHPFRVRLSFAVPAVRFENRTTKEIVRNLAARSRSPAESLLEGSAPP